MATETIYGSTVPASRDNSDGVSYTMGTRFQVSTPRVATHMRWYFPQTIPHPTTQVQAGIYRNSDQVLLGSATFPLLSTLDAWNQVALSPTIPLSVGVEYTAVIWTPLRYPSTSAYFVNPLTIGTFSTPSTAGRFDNSSGFVFPTSNFNNGAYFADVVTESPSSGTPFTRDYSTTWNIRNAFAARDYATTWNIRNAFAARDYATSWSIRNAFAARDYSTTWNIRNALVRDYATTWSIRNGFAQDYATQWAIRNAFTRDYVTTWNILANTSFFRDYATGWNIRNEFARDYQTRWNILSDTPTPPLPANVQAYLDTHAVADLRPATITAWL